MPSPTDPVAPQAPLLRWIGDVDLGEALPLLARQRLCASFFSTKTPLIAGALNGIIISSLAYFRIGEPALLWLAGLDALLLLFRLRALAGSRTGPIFLMGLFWTVLQAAAVNIIIASGDIPMIVFALASIFAVTGTITGRNFAAPRYAMAQILILDLAFKIGFAVQYPQFIALLVPQMAMFVVANLELIRRNRRTAIQAILAEIESRSQSVTDPLTRLLNRRGLEAEYERIQALGARPVLFYLDLDGFKQVNDRLGHGTGDQLLVAVGERLREICGPAACACRLGGDEFLVLIDLPDEEAVRHLGARLVLGLSTPYGFDEATLLRVGVSIGAARRPNTEGLPAQMEAADRALYLAKAAGKGRCVLAGDPSPIPAGASSLSAA